MGNFFRVICNNEMPFLLLPASHFAHSPTPCKHRLYKRPPSAGDAIRQKGWMCMFAIFGSLVELALSNLLYFALHLDNSSLFPKPLSAKEERECFENMEAGDEQARAKLIEHNLRLVAHIVKKYYAMAKDQDDLISIGTIGLIKAVSTFHYEKGARFATYAARCIEKPIPS